MSHDRFIPHGPASYGIEANVGIDLQQADDGQQLTVIPRTHTDSTDPPPKPFLLLPIPALLIEDKARILRRLAYAGRRGIWALYIDTLPPNGWHFYLPPQWASPVGVRANISYPSVQVPGPQLRLAGTFQSAPLVGPDELLPHLPPLDGVHLYLHPAEGWLLITAFITIAGQGYPILSQQVIADPIDPQLNVLSQRLWAEYPQS
jgi:hypothetical protein